MMVCIGIQGKKNRLLQVGIKMHIFSTVIVVLLSIVSLVLIIIAGAILGCPILSIVFCVSLSSYTQVLVVLLIGGAFFAFAVIEQVILTVMRRQVYLLVGFGIASAIAMLISGILVKKLALPGAAYAYTISAGALFLVLGFMIFIFLYLEKKKNK